MSYGSFLRAEQQYYSDRLRERGITECEWHEGHPKFECPECDAAYEASIPDTVKEAEGWA